MSVNGYVALGIAAAILLSPLLLATSPFWLLWLARQRRAGRASGFRVLPLRLARTAELGAEAMVGGRGPRGDWAFVSRNLDRYISGTRSARMWRVKLILALMEFCPVLTGRPPFTKMSLEARRRFLEGPLATTRGLFGLASLGRQLIRLAYYAEPAVAEGLGFRPVGGRERRGIRDARAAGRAAPA